MAKMKPASTEQVREWARDEGWQDERGNSVSERGRLSTSLINDFNKAHKKNRVEYVMGVPGATSTASSTQPKRETTTSTTRATSARSQGTQKASAGGEKASAVSNGVVNPSTVDGMNELIAALASASNGKKEGTPIVLTAHALVYA